MWTHVAVLESTGCHYLLPMAATASTFEQMWNDLANDAGLTLGDEAYASILAWEDMEEAIEGN